MAAGVQIVGLNELRSALRAAESATPRELSRALGRAGLPILAALRGIPARQSGALAGGYRTRVRGTKADIVNVVPYGAGAEWGQHGKWKGFLGYGGPGRFAAREIDEQADAIMDRVADEMREIITIHGWAT